MPRRPRLRYVFGRISGLLAAAMVVALSGCQAEAPRPDVLLVVVDTLRPDFLGAYGFRHPASPNLDALAARGVVFERALAASSRTAPSHASMMTSLWVAEHSIGHANGDTRLEDEVTLAQRFKEAGYDTAAFIGNIVIRSRTGLGAGFDVYDDELPDVERNRSDFFERTAEKTTERALAWLAERGERPYFSWVHYQDPHGPYTPPAPYDRGFEGLEKVGEGPLPVLRHNSGRGGIPAYQALPELVEPGAYRSLYAGEVAFFDASLGRLLAAAQRDRPLVVAFTSDHGESMGEGGYWFAHGHATTPDVAHVPLILVAPGLSPGRRAELVHHVDLMPTLLDLAGLPVGDDARGLPLGRFLLDAEPIPDRVLITDGGNDLAAYRGEEFARLWIRGSEVVSGSFAWSPSEAWAPVPAADELLERLHAYSSQRKPLSRIPEPLGEQEKERLRALGYLEDEDAPAAGP